MRVPVTKRSVVASASTVAATSSGLPMRPSGVVLAILALNSSPRPGTKADSTAPGDTETTRTAGASALASASPTTSRPALAAT